MRAAKRTTIASAKIASLYEGKILLFSPSFIFFPRSSEASPKGLKDPSRSAARILFVHSSRAVPALRGFPSSPSSLRAVDAPDEAVGAVAAIFGKKLPLCQIYHKMAVVSSSGWLTTGYVDADGQSWARGDRSTRASLL
jgi:hypothetical protein